MPYEKEEDERSEINRGPRSGDGVQEYTPHGETTIYSLLTTHYIFATALMRSYQE